MDVMQVIYKSIIDITSGIDKNTYLLAVVSAAGFVIPAISGFLSKKWWRPKIIAKGNELNDFYSVLICPVLLLIINLFSIILAALLFILIANILSLPKDREYNLILVYIITSIIISISGAIIFMEKSKVVTHKYRIPFILIETVIINAVYLHNEFIANVLTILYCIPVVLAANNWFNRRQVYEFRYADITLDNDIILKKVPVNEIENRGTWFILSDIESEELHIPEDKIIRIDYYGKPIRRRKK